MSSYTTMTRRAVVRTPFAEDGVWRESLGGSVPLFVFVTDGPIDAPDWMPAGSMKSTTISGPLAIAIQRQGAEA